MSGPVWALVAAVVLAAHRLRPRAVRPPGVTTRPGGGRRHRGPPDRGRDGMAITAAVVGVVTVGPMTVIVAVICSLVVARTTTSRRRRSHRRAVERALPDAVDLLVVTIRAGYAPRDAVASLVDAVDPVVGAAFAAVGDRTARGDRFADALDVVVEHLGPAALTLVDALASAERTGAPLSLALGRIADDARQQRRRTAEAAARELPVRLSIPLVCCTLPAFVLVAIVPLLIGTLSSIDPP